MSNKMDTSIARKLRQLCSRYDLTAEDLANRVAGHTSRGATKQTVSNYWNGETIPRADFLGAILTEFPEVRAEWLLRDTGPMTIDEEASRRPVDEVDKWGLRDRRTRIDDHVDRALGSLQTDALGRAPDVWTENNASLSVIHAVARAYVWRRFPTGLLNFQDGWPPDDFIVKTPTFDDIHSVLAPILTLVLSRRYGSEGEKVAAALLAFASTYLREFGSAARGKEGEADG